MNLDPTLPRWLEDGSAFLWSTERDGPRALELRGASGKALGTVSSAYQALLSVDRRRVRLRAPHSPIESHVFEVDLDDGPAKRLSQGTSVHDAVFGRETDT